MFHCVLVEPEIPQNTGSIGRLCLATQTTLHLIEPFGFELSDRTLKRAGLDYWQHLKVERYANLDDFFSRNPDAANKSGSRLLLSKKGKKSFFDFKIPLGTYLFFGKETKGLPESLTEKYPEDLVRIPMFDSRVRSLNLAQSVAIGLYESLRQNQIAWPHDGLGNDL